MRLFFPSCCVKHIPDILFVRSLCSMALIFRHHLERQWGGVRSLGQVKDQLCNMSSFPADFATVWPVRVCVFVSLRSSRWTSIHLFYAFLILWLKKENVLSGNTIHPEKSENPADAWGLAKLENPSGFIYNTTKFSKNKFQLMMT